jgi:hypothetical protein
MWCVYPLLDNTCNTHEANSMGTVFSLTANGLSLCNSPSVMSHNSMWPWHDMFPMWCAVMTSLMLGWHNSIVDHDVSMMSDSKLHDKGQTKWKQVVELVVEWSTEEYKRSACENVKSDWKILYAICDSEWWLRSHQWRLIEWLQEFTCVTVQWYVLGVQLEDLRCNTCSDLSVSFYAEISY